MKKMSLLMAVFSVLLSGCAITHYVEPVEAPKARLRIVAMNTSVKHNWYSKNMYFTHITITPDACINTSSDNVVFWVVSNKKYSKTMANRSHSLGMPGKYEDFMSEIYIRAEQPISIGYHFNFMAYVSGLHTNTCDLGVSFTPKENRDYHVVFDLDEDRCYGNIFDATDNPDSPVEIESVLRVPTCNSKK